MYLLDCSYSEKQKQSLKMGILKTIIIWSAFCNIWTLNIFYPSVNLRNSRNESNLLPRLKATPAAYEGGVKKMKVQSSKKKECFSALCGMVGTVEHTE